MQAYLDNSATTRCSEGVRDIVVKVMMEDFGNPSSRHDKGMEAEKYLRDARSIIAGTPFLAVLYQISVLSSPYLPPAHKGSA